MKLYFQRHGLADWPNWKGPDDDRPLNPQGIEQLKAQAKRLKKLNVMVEAILSSPLPRAQQTANLVAEQLGVKVTINPNLVPGFSIGQLPEVLKNYARAEAIMLVGHESDFSTCISSLIGGGRIVLKKGGLARIDLEAREPLRGQLVWLLAPKVLIGD